MKHSNTVHNYYMNLCMLLIANVKSYELVNQRVTVYLRIYYAILRLN